DEDLSIATAQTAFATAPATPSNTLGTRDTALARPARGAAENAATQAHVATTPRPPRPSNPGRAPRSLLDVGFVALALVNVMAVLAFRAEASGGWPVLGWWAGFATSAGPRPVALVAALTLGAGAALAAQGLRSSPVGWGLLISSAGSLTLAY